MKESIYDISANLAELIENFPEDYDYLNLSFVSKNERHTCQDTFFVGKNGKILNGDKK